MTIEQLGEELCNKCQRVYNCSGSDVYEKMIIMFIQSDWKTERGYKKGKTIFTR